MLWLWILNPQYGLLNNILQKLGLYQPNWLTDPRFTKPALLIMGVWGCRQYYDHLSGGAAGRAPHFV